MPHPSHLSCTAPHHPSASLLGCTVPLPGLVQRRLDPLYACCCTLPLGSIPCWSSPEVPPQLFRSGVLLQSSPQPPPRRQQRSGCPTHTEFACLQVPRLPPPGFPRTPRRTGMSSCAAAGTGRSICSTRSGRGGRRRSSRAAPVGGRRSSSGRRSRRPACTLPRRGPCRRCVGRASPQRLLLEGSTPGVFGVASKAYGHPTALFVLGSIPCHCCAPRARDS